MSKYHINNQDKVAPCTATKIPCKYRAPEHFNSKEEAEKELDKRLKKKYAAQQVSLKKGLVNKNNPSLSSNIITKEDNPRFGVSSGLSTMEVYKDKQPAKYSKLPTKDVPVLKNSQRFCKKCNKDMVFDQNKRTFVHSDTGIWACADGNLFSAVNDVCSYCGTGDPKFVTFSEKQYSNETSCSRCGGISGYAIGD